jgi:hypothetical protein
MFWRVFQPFILMKYPDTLGWRFGDECWWLTLLTNGFGGAGRYSGNKYRYWKR